MSNDWGRPWKEEQEESRERRNAIIAWILIPLVAITVLVGLSFGFGWLDVGYKNTVGVASASADRNIFKQNKSYIEGMASDLAKYKYEITTEKDAIARKAIINLIIDKYANFDDSTLSDDLKEFLNKVKNGEVQ